MSDAASGIRITLQNLQDAFNTLPPRARVNGISESTALAGAILRAFFSEEWFERHVMPNARGKGFLTIDDSTPELGDRGVLRIIDLSEVLFNLQYINGFDTCIARMRAGDIEGTYAELDLGRMLFLNSVPFRYVIPQGTKGLDYDIEVLYPDGLVACADSKCKIENTQFSEEGVRNALGAARKQLPDNKPGIIFVKVPPHWMKEAGFPMKMRKVAKEFLRGTGRIVSVKFYVAPVDFGANSLRMQHAYDETNNPQNRFDKTRDWTLFRQFNIPPEWNATTLAKDSLFSRWKESMSLTLLQVNPYLCSSLDVDSDYLPPGGPRTGSPPSPPSTLDPPLVRLLPWSRRLKGPGPQRYRHFKSLPGWSATSFL